MKDQLELPKALIDRNPWEAGSNPIWTATVFQCKRNIARSNFPGKLSTEEMTRLFQLLEKSVSNFFGGDRCAIFPAHRLSPLDKEYLCEHFFCSQGFQNAGQGQGFAIDSQGRFFGQLNIQDHLCLQWIDMSESWEGTWNELARCEETIAKDLPFAFTSQFGFLTADPSQCGTALLVCAYLHVPALILTKTLDEALKNLEDVEVVGLEGTKEDRTGDYLLVRNAYTLGLSEQEILRAVHLAATKIAGAEKAARDNLKKEQNTEAKDLISRSFGLLVHSYKLSTKEAISSLSFLKLGIDLGWITGIKDADINQLFLGVRRASLLKGSPGTSEESPEVHHKRASLLHTKLKSLQLKDDLA